MAGCLFPARFLLAWGGMTYMATPFQHAASYRPHATAQGVPAYGLLVATEFLVSALLLATESLLQVACRRSGYK